MFRHRGSISRTFSTLFAIASVVLAAAGSARAETVDEAKAKVTTLMNAVGTTIATAGTGLTHTQLMPYFDAGFLSDGYGAELQARQMANDMRGVQLANFTVTGVNSYDDAQGVINVRATVQVTVGTDTFIDPLDGNSEGLFIFKRQGDATYKLWGNQRIAQVAIQVEMRTDSMPSYNVPPRQHVNFHVTAPLGVVSSVSVAGPGLPATEPLQTGSTELEQIDGVDYFRNAFYGGFDPSTPIAQGSVYTFTLQLAAGGTATYVVPTIGIPVTDAVNGAVTLTSPTGRTLADANLGTSLPVAWTLPTAYTRARVWVGGQVHTASNLVCHVGGQDLGPNTTATTLAMPGTCNSEAVVMAYVNVSVEGANGERSKYIAGFSGGGTGADITPPTQPGALTLASGYPTASEVRFTWAPSTDASGLVSYDVERNGVRIFSALSVPEAWDTSLAANTSYTYRVSACDPTPNCSSPSIATFTTTASSAQVDAEAAVTALMNEFAVAVNAQAATNALADSHILPFLDAGYLSDGYARADEAKLTANDLRGMQVTDFALTGVNSFDEAAGVLSIRGTLTFSDGNGSFTENVDGRQEGFFNFKRQADGTYRFYGNQRIADLSFQVEIRTDRMNGYSAGPRQHVNFHVDAPEGTINGVTVAGTHLGAPLTLQMGASRLEAGLATPSVPYSFPRRAFYNGFDPATPIGAGASYTFTLTKSDSSTVTYTVPAIGTPISDTVNGDIELLASIGHTLADAALGGSLNLSWVNPTAYTPQSVWLWGYVITDGGHECQVDGPQLPPTTTSYTIALPANCFDENIVQAGFNIMAEGALGERSSYVHGFSSASAGGDTFAPDQPSILSYSEPLPGSQVILYWSPVVDNPTTGALGVASYVIRRYPSPGASVPLASVGPMQTSYTDSSVSPGATYSYTVQACDAATPANCSPESAAFAVTTSIGGGSVAPYTSDASTVLLDHFDSSTAGSVVAFVQDGAACGPAKPSATPVWSYVSGPAGLGQGLSLAPPAAQPAGSGTYIQYPGGQLLSQPNGTIEFWLNVPTYGSGITLVSQGPYPGACAGWTFGMGVSAAGQLQASAWAAFDMNSGATSVPLNQWTHVAASWGSAGAKLYIDGTVVGGSPSTGMPASGYGGSVLFNYSAGDMPVQYDELRISNVQRNAFNLPSGGPTSLSIPAASVTLDGAVGDWGAILPLASDPQADVIPAYTGSGADIKALYAARDGEALYLRLDLWDAFNTGFGNGPEFRGSYRFHIQSNSASYPHLQLGVGFGTYSGLPDFGQWSVGYNGANGLAPGTLAGPSLVAVSGGVMELRIPLADIANPSAIYGIQAAVSDCCASTGGQAIYDSVWAGVVTDTFAPSVPTNILQPSIGTDQITLSWSASTDDIGVTNYRIYQNGNPTPIAVTNLTTYTVSSLAPGTLYTFTIAACDAADNCSPASPPASATTLAGVSLSNVVVLGPTSVPEGTNALFVALAQYTDGSARRVIATWSGTAMINSTTGVLTAPAATSGQGLTLAASGTDPVTSTPFTTPSFSVTIGAPLVSATPAVSSVNVTQRAFNAVSEGGSAQLGARAFYSDNTTQIVTASAAWSLTPPSAASIDASGLLTGAAVSATTPITISATYGSRTGSFTGWVQDGQDRFVESAPAPNGPGHGGIINNIQFTATGVMYAAAADQAVVRSDDGGQTWFDASAGFTRRVNVVRLQPGTSNILYAATNGPGIFRSTDGGGSWTPANNGLGCGYVNNMTTVNATAPNILYAATSCGGFVSADYGASWSLLTGSLTAQGVVGLSRILVDTSSPTSLNLWAVAGTGVYRSTDGGTSWFSINGTGGTALSGPNGTQIRDALFQPSFALVTVEGNGVFRSTGGAVWAPANTGLPATRNPIGPIVRDGGTGIIYIALDGQGAWRSSDNGLSWEAVPGTAQVPQVRYVTGDGTGALWAATLAGIYKSPTGSGTDWTPMKNGLPRGYLVNADSHASAPNVVFAAAGDTVYKSIDGGASWARSAAGIAGSLDTTSRNSVAVDALDANTVYAATRHAGIFRSLDAGTSWSAFNSGLPDTRGKTPGLRVHPNGSVYTFFVNGGGIFRASGGSSWTTMAGDLPGSVQSIFALGLDPNDAGIAYISTNDGLWKTVNGGTNWTKLTSFPGAPGYIRVNSDVSPARVFVASSATDPFYNPTSQSGLYRSTDGGATWTQPIANERVHTVGYTVANGVPTLYVAVWDGPNRGILRSVSAGPFTSMNAGLLNARVRNFETSDDRSALLRAATVNGLYTFIADPASVIPVAPTGVGAAFSGGNIVISWTAVANATGYNVYMANVSGVNKANYGSLSGGHVHANVSSPYTDVSPAPGTYYFVVTAVNAVGESAESAQGTITVALADTTPDPFSFAALTDVTPGAMVTSGNITVTGITAPAAISVTSGEYSIGCAGTFTTASGTVGNGQTVCVRHTAASSPLLSTTTTLTIGGVSADFVSTTGDGTTATFTPALEQSWNLIGNALNVSLDVAAIFGNLDTPVAGVTSKVFSVWKWDAAAQRWAFHSPYLSVAENNTYAANNNYTVLAVIEPGEGYWVNALDPVTLPPQSGTRFTLNAFSFAALPSGWNLLSVAPATPVSPSGFNLQMSATPPAPGVVPQNFYTLWQWYAPLSRWWFYSPLLEASGGAAGVKSYAESMGYLDFETAYEPYTSAPQRLGVGGGFWVNKP